MPKVKRSLLIFLAGFLWLAIGIFLMTLGMRFILSQLYLQPTQFSILACFEPLVNGRLQTISLVLTLALLIGYLKGRYALTKSVTKQVKRILNLPEPAPLSQLYSKGYYFLMASMIGLGFVIRYLPISLDTRGFIDITIGAALINGSVRYFRSIKLPASQKQIL